jgi:hypothetical protein
MSDPQAEFNKMQRDSFQSLLKRLKLEVRAFALLIYLHILSDIIFLYREEDIAIV